MPLKKLETKGTATKKASSVPIKVILVEDNDELEIAKFIQAQVALVKAESTIEKLKPAIKRYAAKQVFIANTANGDGNVKSVELKDKDVEEANLRVTLADSYPTMEAAKAEAIFATVKRKDKKPVDVNDYVHQVRSAVFDNKAFLDGTGAFCDESFNLFFEACEAVAKKLRVPNPLTSAIVTMVKPDFNDRRYKDFGAAEQVMLFEALPNKTSISVVKVEKT